MRSQVRVPSSPPDSKELDGIWRFQRVPLRTTPHQSKAFTAFRAAFRSDFCTVLGVDVHRRRDVRVPEKLLLHGWLGVQFGQQSGVSVPEGVPADVANSCPFRRRFDVVGQE